jgi:hypothetical protein
MRMPVDPDSWPVTRREARDQQVDAARAAQQLHLDQLAAVKAEREQARGLAAEALGHLRVLTGFWALMPTAPALIQSQVGLAVRALEAITKESQ